MEDWWHVLRWKIAKNTGWTLEYIEQLSFESIWSYLSFEDGYIQAERWLAQKKREF